MSYADLDGVPSQTAGVSSLVASDWNTYVRDNFDSIKFGHVVVADNTAKSAISAVEGIMVYQSDVDTLFLYTGSAWVPAVDTVSLVDSAVETVKINDLAVTTAKINDLGVTTGKIAASAVTSAKIADDTIVNADVNSAAAIAYSKLNLSSSVTSADIVDNTIVIGDLAAALQAFLVPTGTVSAYAKSTAPTGYLLCNGDTVPNGSGTVQGVTTDFSALYIILGTSFGTAGTLPNLLGRSVVGAGAAGAQNGTSSSGSLTGGTALTARTVGAFFGDQYLQEHTHAAGYTVSGTVSSDGQTAFPYAINQYAAGSGSAFSINVQSQGGGYIGGSFASANSHTHPWSGTISGNSGAHSMANQGAAGTANANMQPSLSLTYIIKY